MDFKSLLSKLDSMDAPVAQPAVPELPKAVQLNEDAQLRVLAGTTSYVVEAEKKAKEEKVAEEMKVGDTKKTAKGGTVTKTEKGITHKAGPGSYGGSDDKDTDPDADDEAAKGKKGRKRSNEAIDAEAFKGKFAKMVEAKKDEKKDTKKKPMKEAAKPDFLDVDKDGDKKEPMKKAAAEKGGDKKDGKKGMSDKQAKYFGKKNESVKTSKKVVAESVETKLSFKQMVQLVQESGGQQQIDPKDKELFNWASRVAASKLGEGMKAELYAGLIYERNGGVFEMYDVLSEDQK
jgi:hypothetical protein